MSKDQDKPSGSGQPPTQGPPPTDEPSHEPPPFQPDLELITYLERSQKPRRVKKA